MRVNSQQKIKKIKHSFVHIIAWIFVFAFFSPKFLLTAQNKPFTVVLDPGHGGKDPGTMGTKRYKNLFEKDIVLKVALKAGKILENEYPEIKVIYTRKKDEFIELRKRGEIANKADADLFISIHINAASKNARGTETYVLGVHRNESNLAVAIMENDVIMLEENYEKHYSYNPKKPESLIGLTLMQEDFLDQSIRMSKILEEYFKTSGKRHSRGVNQAGFVVLHQSYMPSVLTEIGFLSNPAEEDFLRSEKGQETIARAIVKSIVAYKSELEKNKSMIDRQNIQSTESQIYEGVTFKVQIASGSNSVETKTYNFKGLKGVERVKVGAFYKYYYGNTSDYEEIKKNHALAIEKGYKGAFIVAFRGDERLSLDQLLKEK